MHDLKNKTVVITGAAGLLGKALARKFAGYNSKLVLIDINEAVLSLAKELRSQQVDVLPLVKDITTKSSWFEILHEIDSKEFKPDVLVNNTCVKTENFFKSFEDYDLEDWNGVMAANLTSYMLASQSIGSRFAMQKRGSIINISSIYGVTAPDQRIYEGAEYLGMKINTPAVYSASKAGIIGLAKYLSTYWGKDNVRSNCVTPGGIFSGQNETFVKRYSEKVPLARMANEEDIMAAICFLASDMSSYITGQNIIVDGGWTAW